MSTTRHPSRTFWTITCLGTCLGVLFLIVAFSVRQEEAFGQSATTPTTNVLHATLNDFTIHLNTATIPSGPITIEAINAGTQIHELVVLRTDRAPAGLVQTRYPEEATEGGEGLRVNEHDPAVEPIDEIEEFPAGTRAVKQVYLNPGQYVLFCNIPNHYQKGMFTSLQVTE